MPVELILSIIDSILKLAVLHVQSLPDAERAHAAAQFEADVNWWRDKLHIPNTLPVVPTI